ncbi:MAG TPA: GNAT family N-acetyltransferase [Thermoanaerobaculia bacterium]|nr:GNAT family N-acetyltransferase [Thermoanaerobaculia bacterium]
MPADGLVIRRYRPGDETAILDLFNRSFDARGTIEHWRWKYEDDPYGGHRISIATDDGALAAHYAGYPVAFRAGGTDLAAHQIGDTMTDPSVRHLGRGPTSILGRTSQHFYETFCERQVAFNYGFNVSNIQKFSVRFLRAHRVEDVAYRRRDLRSDPLQALGRVEKYARGVGLELVRSASAEWDELFDRVSPHYGFLVRRDARYATWRYFGRPDVTYFVVTMRKWRRLAGWLVFVVRHDPDRLLVVDLFVDPDHADIVEAALRHLTAVYRVGLVEIWCPARPRWIGEMMDALRLVRCPEPQDLGVMCVPFLDAAAVERIRDSLYYSMADSDLF